MYVVLGTSCSLLTYQPGHGKNPQFRDLCIPVTCTTVNKQCLQCLLGQLLKLHVQYTTTSKTSCLVPSQAIKPAEVVMLLRWTINSSRKQVLRVLYNSQLSSSSTYIQYLIDCWCRSRFPAVADWLLMRRDEGSYTTCIQLCWWHLSCTCTQGIHSYNESMNIHVPVVSGVGYNAIYTIICCQPFIKLHCMYASVSVGWSY